MQRPLVEQLWGLESMENPETNTSQIEGIAMQ